MWRIEVEGQKREVDGLLIFIVIGLAFSEMHLVAIPVGVSADLYYMECNILLRFVVVMKLEHVNLQNLAMLAHLAKHDSSCFVEVWICTTLDISGFGVVIGTYPRDPADPTSWLVNTARSP